MKSLFRCVCCGDSLKVVDKRGPNIHVMCNSCGFSSLPELRKKKEVIVINRRQTTVESERRASF